MANRESALPPLSSSEVLEILFGERGRVLPDGTRLPPLSGGGRPVGWALDTAKHKTTPSCFVRVVWHRVIRAVS